MQEAEEMRVKELNDVIAEIKGKKPHPIAARAGKQHSISCRRCLQKISCRR